MSPAGQVALVAGFVVVYSALSGRLGRWAITGPLVFLVVGVVVGPDGVDAVSLSLDNNVVELIAEITLVIVLFSDAARIRFDLVRHDASPPTRLLGIGMPLTIALGTGVGVLVLGAPWELAALAASILAPTDAALGQAVVSNPRVPLRVRQTLNVESGLNDGLSVPFVTLFLGLTAAEEGLRTPQFWLEFIVKQIGFGVAVGLAVGFVGAVLVEWASRKLLTDPAFRPIGMLAGAVLAWSLANVVDGNGFIAAFVAGLVAGNITRAACEGLFEFVEREGQLLTLLTFLIFGGAFVGPALGEVGWRVGLYAVLSLTVVRMLPVAVSLLGSGSAPSTLAFIGWFGPRGLASIVLALGALEDLGALADEVLLVVTVTVTLSVFAHGLSAEPLSERYGATMERMAQVSPEPMAEHRFVPEIRSRLGRFGSKPRRRM